MRSKPQRGNPAHSSEQVYRDMMAEWIADAMQDAAERIEHSLAAIPEAIRMVRPRWEHVSGWTAYLACNCGMIIRNQQEMREHWQQGHFDRLVSGAA